ncbi:hypothetical protein ACFLTX_00215 [Chloroflexota bacterium]
MKTTTIATILIALALLLLCCVCVAGISVSTFYLIRNVEKISDQIPTELFKPSPTSTPTVVITRPPLVSITIDTLDLLERTIVPENNLSDIYCRLEGICDVPNTFKPPSVPLQIGDRETFWVNNLDTSENVAVNVTLRAISSHAYFWIEDNVYFNQFDLDKLMSSFENEIYPDTRAFFGSEWTPGVDGDPHIYIVYATGLGSSIAGYFSSADEYNPLIHEFSNGHEMFYINAGNSPLHAPETYGVVTHEFQHLILWNNDRNETSWLNEGFSELSAFLSGFDPGVFDYLFSLNPDLQLNDWPNDSSSTSPHYGASFLFTNYFLNRFGDTATRELVASPLNGLDSIDEALLNINAIDPQTGNLISADDLFLDWTITNFLNDGDIADGRYKYHNYPNAPRTMDTETIRSCPTGLQDRPVNQYGADYIQINCQGDHTLSFNGSTVTKLVPMDPYSGEYAFWSNKGDDSDMTLTREFDFTSVAAPGNLSFMTWYDIELDYDYLYLEASTDGKKWEILQTTLGTDLDPNGNSFGWAFNGTTSTWMQEYVDLSRFAGQKVFIRFEYVTDAAANGEGFLLDDVRVDSIGYFSDFETDDGGWVAEGFVKVRNVLPQTFQLALILVGNTTRVEKIKINADQSVDIPLKIGGDIHHAVLIVTGSTRYTRELASYQFEIR